MKEVRGREESGKGGEREFPKGVKGEYLRKTSVVVVGGRINTPGGQIWRDAK